ncbi:hypothetical protein QQG55_41450 [Brugia pahangi]
MYRKLYCSKIQSLTYHWMGTEMCVVNGWPSIRFHILKGRNGQASVGSDIRSVALSFFEGQALFFCILSCY